MNYQRGSRYIAWFLCSATFLNSMVQKFTINPLYGFIPVFLVRVFDGQVCAYIMRICVSLWNLSVLQIRSEGDKCVRLSDSISQYATGSRILPPGQNVPHNASRGV